MNGIIHLAWQYIKYYRTKSIILTICLSLTILLPLAAGLIINLFGDQMMSRGKTTPLLVGSQGDRFDLVLKGLYFTSTKINPVSQKDVEYINTSGLGKAIPLHLEHTARKFPVVGTSLGYFEMRGLTPSSGTLPLRLGQAVLGAAVADELGLKPGDHLFSDQVGIYDLTGSYPLKMEIAGVLNRTDTADDRAVFTDIKTAWVIDGITHGHQKVSHATAADIILQQSDSNIITNSSIVEYNEITKETAGSYHTHAKHSDLPVSAIIVIPKDSKSATILKARYSVSKTRCLLVPKEIVEEMLSLVLKIKRFFDASFALVTTSTVLFVILVVMLSYQLRKREMQTMQRIGCARLTAFWLLFAELAIIVIISVLTAILLASLTLLIISYFVQLR